MTLQDVICIALQIIFHQAIGNAQRTRFGAARRFHHENVGELLRNFGPDNTVDSSIGGDLGIFARHGFFTT